MMVAIGLFLFGLFIITLCKVSKLFEEIESQNKLAKWKGKK